MSAPALRFDHVSFTYPEVRARAGRRRPEIAEGTFVLAIGPTGAGKSTFLRVARTAWCRTSRAVASRGRVHAWPDATRLEHPPRALADVVAFVPQDASASFVLDRVEDELAYGMENLASRPRTCARRVEEML